MQGWIWLTLGEGEHFLAFAYIDPTAGPSAKGVQISGMPTAEQIEKITTFPGSTFRMPMGQSTALSPHEIEQLGLPQSPEWMQHYKQPETPWSNDPRLAGAFHASYPNDLQAMFFMPCSGTVESMWVTLKSEDPAVDGYVGQLLNDAHGDPDLRSGTMVTIRPTAGVQQPVWVSAVSRSNYSKYRGACTECGFDLVLTPVESIIAQTFPDVPPDARLEQFTTRCAMCQGTQMLTQVPN